MTLAADLYFSYRSPYSYFAAQRWRELIEEWDLAISVKVVYPIAVRDPGFFERANPMWLPYLVRDIMRLGEFTGLPIAMPRPDPIVMNMATREIAAEQPIIRPISYLGVEAESRGAGLTFAAEASKMIWGGVENWNAPETLAGAAERAGLSLPAMEAAIDDEVCEAEIAANQTALEKAGHWGVPTLVFEGEPFFGQDRIDMALWRLQSKGLTRR